MQRRTVLDAGPPDGLLADTCHHLTNVDGGALGATERHDEWAVVPRQLLQAHVAGDLAHATEHAKDAAFKRLLRRAAGQQLQLPLFELRNQALTFRVALLHLRMCCAYATHVLNTAKGACGQERTGLAPAALSP